MRACFLRLLAMAGGLLLASAAQAAPEVQPRLKTGNWRIAVSMEVPNATGPSTGPSQHDRCLNASDTRNLLMIPPGAACTIRESKLTADQLDPASFPRTSSHAAKRVLSQITGGRKPLAECKRWRLYQPSIQLTMSSLACARVS